MKRSIFTFLFLALSIFGFGQNHRLIGSAGTYTSGATGSIEWSIGEVVIVTTSGGANILSQGFHQAFIYVEGIEEIKELNVSIYPNPTSEFVNIVCLDPVKLSIYDMSGRLVGKYDLIEENNQINVTDLTRGAYNLVFESKNAKYKTAKLIVQ